MIKLIEEHYAWISPILILIGLALVMSSCSLNVSITNYKADDIKRCEEELGGKLVFGNCFKKEAFHWMQEIK
jgi:hypothetical protein